MKALVTLFIVIASIITSLAQPTISAPTQNQVFYEGEAVTLNWNSTRASAWKTVNIRQLTLSGSGWDYVKVGAPNTGHYEWTASQFRGNEEFILEIADGGQVAHRSTVVIAVKSGTRPSETKPVVIGLQRARGLNWESTPGDTYFVEEKNGTNDWTSFWLVEADDIQTSLAVFTSQNQYRVWNMSREVEVAMNIFPAVAIDWASVPNCRYKVETSTDLTTWQVLIDGVAAGDRCQVIDWVNGNWFSRVSEIK